MTEILDDYGFSMKIKHFRTCAPYPVVADTGWRVEGAAFTAQNDQEQFGLEGAQFVARIFAAGRTEYEEEKIA